MNGCAAFTAEVLESLNRQGARPLPRAVKPGSNTLRWDAWADAFTLAAYQIGKTPTQVMAALSIAGYQVTVEDVVARLHGSGVVQVTMY